MSAGLVVTLGFTSCLTKSEVLYEVVCYDIEFESDFIVILYCFMYSTVVNFCCINMCFINKVKGKRHRFSIFQYVLPST